MVTKIIYMLAAAAVLAGCQKLVLPKDDDACDLRSLTVYVHYDAQNPGLSESFDALTGNLDETTGEGTFSFPKDPEKYNAQTLARCTVEATIPSTAKLVVYDEEGNVREQGLGGTWDLANHSIVMDVVAASGKTRRYDFLFRMRR